MAGEYATSLRKTPVVATPAKAPAKAPVKTAPKQAAPVVEKPKTVTPPKVTAPAPAPVAAPQAAPVVPRAAAPVVEAPRAPAAPIADANSANAREGRTQNFISGGTGATPAKPTVDLGRAASSTGSFIANELLGVDDMRNAYQHAKSGNWTGVGRSALAIGAELGGTVAAAAAIGLSGGTATPGVAALYAGKVAAKKGAKEVAEVGVEQAMKNAEKKAAETTLKRAGAPKIEKSVLKSDVAEGKAIAKEATELDKLTSLKSDRKFLTKGRDEIGKMTGEKPTGIQGGNPLKSKGSSKYGTDEGGLGGPGSGGGRGGAQGGTPGSRGPIGSEGGGSAGLRPGGGGRSGTATLERTQQRTSPQFTRPGGGGGADDLPTFRPKTTRPTKPKSPNSPGGSSGGAVQEQKLVKIGADLSKPGKLEAPDASARVFPRFEDSVVSRSQLSNRNKAILGAGTAIGLGAATATQLGNGTITGPTTITGVGGGIVGPGPGGGGGPVSDPIVEENLKGGVGQQDVLLKKVF